MGWHTYKSLLGSLVLNALEQHGQDVVVCAWQNQGDSIKVIALVMQYILGKF